MQYLSHVVHVRAQHGFEAVGLLQQLGHGAHVLPHVLLALLLLVEELGQVVPQTQLHLEAPQRAVEPNKETHCTQWEPSTRVLLRDAEIFIIQDCRSPCAVGSLSHCNGLIRPRGSDKVCEIRDEDQRHSNHSSITMGAIPTPIEPNPV